MKTKQEFPLALRRDSVSVKIYRADSKGFAEFTLAYRQQGRRIRRVFTDLKQARQAAERVLTKLSQEVFDVLTLRGPEKLEYTRAKEALAESGLPLDWVAVEHARLQRELNGHGTLAEAVANFVKTHHHIRAERQVEEVVKELVDTRKRAGSSQRHVYDLDSRLTRFAAAFRCGSSSVTAGEIQDFTPVCHPRRKILILSEPFRTPGKGRRNMTKPLQTKERTNGGR